MTNIKYQNYKHYKLPITMNPTEYGRIIDQSDNIYIIHLNSGNAIIIKEIGDENFIKFFRKGELIFEFKDSKISNNRFCRYIQDQKFTFREGKLISTEIISSAYNILINPLNTIKKFYSNIPTFGLNTIMDWIDNSKDPLKAFLVWELFIILFLYIIFVILPDIFYTNENLTLVALYPGNIIKLRKNKSKNVWNELSLSFANKVFSRQLFEIKFNQFWNKIQSEFKENNHMFILFKIKYVNNEFVTIGKLQRLNLSDKNWYINWIIDNMILKSEYYNETAIESFIFSYGFKNETIPEKETINNNVNFQKYKNNKIIISYNPLDYGKLITKINFENYIQFVLQTKENLLVKINKFEKYNELSLISSGNTILNFKDEFISDSKFVRNLDDKKYYFENNKEILFTKEMKTKFITKISSTKNLQNNFITFDIETFVKNSILVVYCISIFDGKTVNYFFLDDYENVDKLIITALKSIMIRKYNGYNVYMHNMAKFDIIFLLKYLVKLGCVHPIIHNERIISINFNFGEDNKYQIKFKDSLLLLLISLSKLCKSFGVENPKSIFPIFFVNENNLDYIGEVPDIKYFKNINLKDYEKYKANFNNNWNLKNEAIKYCNLDCISLYQVLYKFTELIFDLFQKNIHHYPTLPSLAFAIFRSKFMDEENIPQLSGKIAEDIRQGYTGGSCDVFIPESKPGVKIKCYDVNSLYPSIMEKYDMPVGKPTYFKGDILKSDSNAFGFFYCKIIAPDNILHPILQTHVKTGNGVRTISPIGTWEDMLFSEELKNALKFGYNFEILWGYTFKRKNIFKDYVNFLYSLRSQYPKSHPLNLIAKLLLNSLYGRFGMDDDFPEINIIHKDYYNDFENKFIDNILKSEELGDYKLVTYKQEKIENDEITHNISISIAAAITAYSRVYMSQFKNNPEINLYYTDTDSLYVDENSEIPINLIDNKILGKLKLEHTCKKTIFLAPKVYCLETEDIGLVYKVKGLKHDIELNMKDFEDLLIKESNLKKLQTKFKKSLGDGNIKLLEQIYTLQVTDNKRKLIYNKNNKWISTQAYKICNKKKKL